MGRPSNRVPFSETEWVCWREDFLTMESHVRQCARHAGIAFGPKVEDRGRRIARDLATYREYVGTMAFATIADGRQLDLFLGSSGAWV